MTTPGTVGRPAASSTAARRCPLCAHELTLASGSSSDCPNCGFDVGQVGAARRKPEPVEVAQPPAAPLDTLDRWLAGESLQPRNLTDSQRFARWLRQHPRTAALAAAAILVALVVPVASWVAYTRSLAALHQAELERATATEQQRELANSVAAKSDELILRQAQLDEHQQSQQELKQSLSQLHAEYEQSRQQCLAAEARLKDEVRAARLAMAEDFTLQAESLRNGMPEVSLVLAAKALSITQQEGLPPITGALQQVRDLLAPTDGIELRGHDGPVAQIAASRDGSWLASGDHQGVIRLWSTTSRAGLEQPRVLDGQWGRITQLVFTGDNRHLVSGSTDSTVHLWRLAASGGNMSPLLLKTKQGRFASLATSDDGRWLAIAGAGHVTNEVFIRVWDLRADDVRASAVDLPAYRGELCALAVSRDGDWLATGNEDGAVRLWRISKLTRAVTATDLRMHNEPVRVIRFAADGQSLITAAGAGGGKGKGTVRAWSLDASDASADMVLADNSRGVELFAISSDGRWLFTANDEPSLRVRDLTALKQDEAGSAIEGQTCAVQALALSANNRWLATAGTDNTVRLWYIGADGPAATPLTIRAPRGLVTGIAFAGKGNWLATGNDRGNVQLWNLAVDELIRLANGRLERK